MAMMCPRPSEPLCRIEAGRGRWSSAAWLVEMLSSVVFFFAVWRGQTNSNVQQFSASPIFLFPPTISPPNTTALCYVVLRWTTTACSVVSSVFACMHRHLTRLRRFLANCAETLSRISQKVLSSVIDLDVYCCHHSVRPALCLSMVFVGRRSVTRCQWGLAAKSRELSEGIDPACGWVEGGRGIHLRLRSLEPPASSGICLLVSGWHAMRSAMSRLVRVPARFVRTAAATKSGRYRVRVDRCCPSDRFGGWLIRLTDLLHYTTETAEGALVHLPGTFALRIPLLDCS